MFRVIQRFVFVFGRIVHRTARIRPNSLKPLFVTSPEVSDDIIHLDHMIRALHKTTSVSVIDAKFHKNPLFRLQDFQFFQIAVTNLSYWCDILPCWRHLWLLHFPAGQCPSTLCPWDSCATVSGDTRLHQPTGLATEQSRSQSGGLCDLGHSAGMSPLLLGVCGFQNMTLVRFW